MAQKISLADWQQQLGRSASNPENDSSDNLVYSTDQGKVVKPKPAETGGIAYPDGAIRLRREKKGRGGKTVLTISGIAKPVTELTEICAALKKKCACGGAVKDGIIEIQADKRQLIEQHLSQLGFNVKWSGG
ncbi:translation initiation factor 1 (eIF-1/SUI1) [Arsukibacterium tuosuense]|uniref:Translation initiation factor 1 (eIF-1/SUI1) n=1 Tax=Arsukibacterium tuosuense TaxID=1323745 RepID=A0A285IEQ4_9GAMM|nr:translation initiation factor [Arsukibacterium tuosuense]SNY46432.1 translation initiation factor 1 (eIF-1/SUI1) [Arsukibacterium tuosuense]